MVMMCSSFFCYVTKNGDTKYKKIDSRDVRYKNLHWRLRGLGRLIFIFVYDIRQLGNHRCIMAEWQITCSFTWKRNWGKMNYTACRKGNLVMKEER
jgi:hypothetical protein